MVDNVHPLVFTHLNSALQDFAEAVQLDDNKAIIEHLERLIPEFKRTKMKMSAANTAS
jgi:hypothetical protein